MIIARTAFLERLFECLWHEYRGRVEHARAYEDLLLRRGGTFRNDHVAFRTFAAQSRWSGIAAVSRPFEALGYRAAGAYDFPDESLTSLHFAPPDEKLPKIFISELRVWELSPRARRIVAGATARSAPRLSDADLAALSDLPRLAARRREALLRRWASQFARPWPAPRASAPRSPSGPTATPTPRRWRSPSAIPRSTRPWASTRTTPARRPRPTSTRWSASRGNRYGGMPVNSNPPGCSSASNSVTA